MLAPILFSDGKAESVPLNPLQFPARYALQNRLKREVVKASRLLLLELEVGLDVLANSFQGRPASIFQVYNSVHTHSMVGHPSHFRFFFGIFCIFFNFILLNNIGY